MNRFIHTKVCKIQELFQQLPKQMAITPGLKKPNGLIMRLHWVLAKTSSYSQDYLKFKNFSETTICRAKK